VIFADDDKNEMTFRSCSGGGAHLCVNDEVRFTVTPDLLPDVIREMCEKAGTSAPVMLGRPDLDAMRGADGSVPVRGLRLRESGDGGVTVSAGGNAETLSPAQTRLFAAAAVALADESRDEGDVFVLASVMAKHPGATFPELARAVLADGRFGRTDGAR
jgi:hypothetical protein